MARRPRLQFPGAIYHVMSRGNRKSPIFEDDHDRRVFVDTVNDAVERYAIRCYAFCLMNNHYHLVIDTPRGNLSDAMRQINGVFTQSTNRRYQRTGHLFEGRFKSIVVQRESYLRRVARYVVLNPVRARLVVDASAWQWSSYRSTAGLELGPSHLYTDWIDWAFAGADRHESQRKYRLFVNDAIKRHSKIDHSTPVLGTPAFMEAVRADTAAAVSSEAPLPRVYRSLARPTLTDLFAMARSREGRNACICEAHVKYGYRLAEIASFLGLHPSTASAVFRSKARR